MTTFADFSLPEPIQQALTQLQYQSPTDIQAQAIPVMLQGKDVLARAATGTGKTAAYALPTLAQLNLEQHTPQVVVVLPTRELALQVADDFQAYGKYLPNLHVAKIYGGQPYSTQLRALKRGAHVIVGTPGRLKDHVQRGTLSLSAVHHFILDEGDEMLKMGFVEDIEWIMAQLPETHQSALFSATLPKAVQKLAETYFNQPEKIFIKKTQKQSSAISQSFVHVERRDKLAVLLRFLDIETVNAAIIFTRTKSSSSELAEQLQSNNIQAAALNGDMNQSAREKVLNRLREGDLKVVIATDVAARGIDIDHVTHVFNFDIPHDAEAYTHRIGRTGRAGRDGKAILFVSPREFRHLRLIEKQLNEPILEIDPPSWQDVLAARDEKYIEKIKHLHGAPAKWTVHKARIEAWAASLGCPIVDLAAIVLSMQDGDVSIQSSEKQKRKKPERTPFAGHRSERDRAPRRKQSASRHKGPRKPKREQSGPVSRKRTRK